MFQHVKLRLSNCYDYIDDIWCVETTEGEER